MTNPAQPISPTSTIPAPAPEEEEKEAPWEEVVAGLKTLGDLADLVDDRCDYDTSLLPRVDLICWHQQKTGIELSILLPMVTAAIDAGQGLPAGSSTAAKDALKEQKVNALITEMNQTIFQRGLGCPLGPERTVIYMFRGDPIRIYCFEIKKHGPDGKQIHDIRDWVLAKDATGKAPKGARYILNPNSYQCAYETMPFEIWITSVIGELDALGQETFGEVDEEAPQAPQGGSNGN